MLARERKHHYYSLPNSICRRNAKLLKYDKTKSATGIIVGQCCLVINVQSYNQF